MGKARGDSKVEKLVYCTENEYGGKHIHQAVDECVWKQGEDGTKDEAAKSDNGKHRFRLDYEVALGVVDVKVAVGAFAFGGKVGYAADYAGDEEDDTDENGNPRYGLLTIFYEQCSDDDCADGAKNGTLKDFHSCWS